MNICRRNDCVSSLALWFSLNHRWYGLGYLPRGPRRSFQIYSLLEMTAYPSEFDTCANAPLCMFTWIANAPVCTSSRTWPRPRVWARTEGRAPACSPWGGGQQSAVWRWLSARLINDPSETCPATLELMYLPQSTRTKLCSERKWCQQPLAFTHKKIKIYCHHRQD